MIYFQRMYGLPVSDIAATILKSKGCPITCQAGTEGTKKYSSANTRSCARRGWVVIAMLRPFYP